MGSRKKVVFDGLSGFVLALWGLASAFDDAAVLPLRTLARSQGTGAVLHLADTGRCRMLTLLQEASRQSVDVTKRDLALVAWPWWLGAHRHARVPGVGLLHLVDGQRAQGVDAAEVEILIARPSHGPSSLALALVNVDHPAHQILLVLEARDSDAEQMQGDEAQGGVRCKRRCGAELWRFGDVGPDDPACGTLCSRCGRVCPLPQQTISISFRIKLTSVIAMYDSVLTRCPTSNTLCSNDD